MARPRSEIRHAAEAAGIPYLTLYDRVKRQGMTLAEAVARGQNPLARRHPARAAAAAVPEYLTPDQASRQRALAGWRRAAA